MTAGVKGRIARWRALLGILWEAGRWRVAGFAALALLAGGLPTVAILATGVLVRAIQGPEGPGGMPARLALAGMLSTMAAAALSTAALTHLSRVLNVLYALKVHETVARITLGTPGLAPLEDPAVADELQAVRDAERREVLRRTATHLSSVLTTRLRGIGALAVLFAFAWWAPLVLAAAWHLTNRLFLKATENGFSFDMGDGAVKLRRSEYLRTLALDPPAAKEVRVFGLGGWVVARY
ncbi:MAG TPA: hypothetical protein VGO40_02780, partial [Longimicrobium sp.]|nr:hypothetical protein [Longimicrobium sp.]